MRTPKIEHRRGDTPAEIDRKHQRSEARLKAAIDLVGLSCYAWDPATDRLDWDDGLRAMWGLPPGAHVDIDVFFAGLHPQDRPRIEAAIAACIDPAGDGVYSIEYRVVGIEDGAERWVSTYGQTSFENGRPVAFIGAALDITKRKKAEERLRQSEAYLSAILQQLPVGVGVFDVNGRLALGNEAFQRYVGDEMASRAAPPRWRSFRQDGSTVPQAAYPTERALRGETTIPGMELLHTSEGGGELWTRVSGAPLRDGSGAITGAVTTIQDIDQQRRRDAALRESEERFRQFAEHSTDVLWILDAEDMRLEYVSPAFETIWGEPLEAKLKDGVRWGETICPEDRPDAFKALDRVLAGETAVDEYRIIRLDGTVRWIRDTLFPICDEYGLVRRVGGIAEDITRHTPSQVYVVDSNESSRQSLSLMLRGAGYDVNAFNSARAFLKIAAVLVSGCVVLDIRAAKAGGPSIPKELKARRSALPVIVIGSSQGQVAHAVQAMRAGAVDWLEAPFERDTLLTAVASAFADIRSLTQADRKIEIARARIAEMTARERDVLAGLMAGDTNKEIARRLGISPRTVEVHRARVMERLGVRTLPEAVLLAASTGGDFGISVSALRTLTKTMVPRRGR
jgi:PAS domain S-box-containing protein